MTRKKTLEPSNGESTKDNTGRFGREELRRMILVGAPELGDHEISVLPLLAELRERPELSSIPFEIALAELEACANQYRQGVLADDIIDKAIDPRWLKRIAKDCRRLLIEISELSDSHSGNLQRQLLASEAGQDHDVRFTWLLVRDVIEALGIASNTVALQSPKLFSKRGREPNEHVDVAARLLHKIWTQCLQQPFSRTYLVAEAKEVRFGYSGVRKEFTSVGSLFIQIAMQALDPSLELSAIRTSIEKIELS